MSRLALYVSCMSNRVRQPQRVTFRAVKAGRFFIMAKRILGAMPVSLNLAQRSERPSQLNSDAARTGDSDGLDQIPLGVLKPTISPSLNRPL